MSPILGFETTCLASVALSSSLRDWDPLRLGLWYAFLCIPLNLNFFYMPSNLNLICA